MSRGTHLTIFRSRRTGPKPMSIYLPCWSCAPLSSRPLAAVAPKPADRARFCTCSTGTPRCGMAHPRRSVFPRVPFRPDPPVFSPPMLLRCHTHEAVNAGGRADVRGGLTRGLGCGKMGHGSGRARRPARTEPPEADAARSARNTTTHKVLDKTSALC